MNIFAQILRDIVESKEGRIVRVPGHWKLAPDETRDDGRYPIEGKQDAVAHIDRYVVVSTDKAGRKMRLIKRRAVHCPNPEYGVQFASLNEKIVCLSVPESFCRKCPHYKSARASRRKYATCGYMRTENPASDSLKEFNELLKKAVRCGDCPPEGCGGSRPCEGIE